MIGFCLGGGFALVLAGRPGWDAVAANYGALPQDLAALDGACPVVASYGGRDRYLRGAASTLETALTERGVEHDVKEYPDAGHAFLNETANAPWYIAPMSRLVLRAGPEPASAQRRVGRGSRRSSGGTSPGDGAALPPGVEQAGRVVDRAAAVPQRQVEVGGRAPQGSRTRRDAVAAPRAVGSPGSGPTSRVHVGAIGRWTPTAV